MTKKTASLAPWAIGLVLLALPVAAEDTSSGLGGIFQGIYDTIAVWLGSAIDDPELTPMILPGGLTSSERDEAVPYIPPGG